jgi:hypothetical protein
MPRITKAIYGGYQGDVLIGIVTFGGGTRPSDTIRVMFPSLITSDYFEVGKMCLRDDAPKNSESEFLCRAIKRVKADFPALKLIFSWSDGMWGKAGYIYQASNFLYGGFIWTDAYVNSKGTRIHPRQSNKWKKSVGLSVRAGIKTDRPNYADMYAYGLKHYSGKMFRYCRFVCDAKEQRRLLDESSFTWTREYPKDADLEWKRHTLWGKVPCLQPTLTGALA